MIWNNSIFSIGVSAAKDVFEYTYYTFRITSGYTSPLGQWDIVWNDNRWIPLKRGQQRGKGFHTITSWWRHQMETFSALLALGGGNSPITGEFTKASDAECWCFLWSAPWINGWVNTRNAGDLRRKRAHYDIIVMFIRMFSCLTAV